jgi:hypothetical protein
MVNFSMSRLLLKCLETKYFFRSSASFVKSAWYSDVRSERRALTEFNVAEKKSPMNFHMAIKRIYGVNPVNPYPANVEKRVGS